MAQNLIKWAVIFGVELAHMKIASKTAIFVMKL